MYTYRKYSAHYVIFSVLLGYDLWQHKEKHRPSRKEWSDYVEALGINVKKAATLMRVARKLYRNPVTDRKRLDEIVALRIPWMALVGACADSISDEQRQQFFETIERRGSPETLSEDEAWSVLKSIAHPIQQGQLPLSLPSEPPGDATRIETMRTLGEALRRTLSAPECAVLAQCLSAS
jgi:hypothetical protein